MNVCLRPAEQVFTCAIEPHEPQRLALLDEQHERNVFDDCVEECVGSLEFFLDALALAEISYDDDEARLTFELRPKPDCLDAPKRAVATDHSELPRRGGEPGLQQGSHPFPNGGMIVGVEQLDNRLANQRRPVVMSQQACECVVRVDDDAAPIGEHTVGHVLDQPPILGL